MRNPFLMLCLVLVFAVAGCVRQGVDPEGAAAAPQLFPCEVKTIGLPSSLLVAPPALGTAPSGFARVEVGLENQSTLKVTVLHSVEWFDSEGFSLPTVMARQNRVVIPGHQTYRITAVAPSAKAYRAVVTVSRSQ